MPSCISCYYHVVWGTKHRRPTLVKANRERLYHYMLAMVKERDSKLLRIGGVEDHLQLLVGMHQSHALADFMREIKAGSSKWIRENEVFPNFTGWQDGYGAFTIGWKDREPVIEYINNQEAHHHKKTYVEELREMVEECGLRWDPDHLPE